MSTGRLLKSGGCTQNPGHKVNGCYRDLSLVYDEIWHALVSPQCGVMRLFFRGAGMSLRTLGTPIIPNSLHAKLFDQPYVRRH
jgi:hypothetical protein